MVRQFGGLEPLVRLLLCSENKKLLASVTGAVWKCAVSHENAKRCVFVAILYLPKVFHLGGYPEVE